VLCACQAAAADARKLAILLLPQLLSFVQNDTTANGDLSECFELPRIRASNARNFRELHTALSNALTSFTGEKRTTVLSGGGFLAKTTIIRGHATATDAP